jgi:5'-nucleotidase / UDP-sugar diphosphatase
MKLKMGIALCSSVAWMVLAACGAPQTPPDGRLGTTTVDLELTERLTRNQEAPIGNLAADAALDLLKDLGVQVAFINGGSLRCPSEFDAVQCAGWKIDAGPITQEHLDTVVPFNGEFVIKTISGADLKSTLERSVATIPSTRKGWFLHPAGQTYSADCSRAAQQISSTTPKTIISEGSRITAITVNGVPYSDTASYVVAAPAFTSAGSDGHVQMGLATPTSTGLKEHDAWKAYLEKKKTVSPAVEGRITLTASCVSP